MRFSDFIKTERSSTPESRQDSLGVREPLKPPPEKIVPTVSVQGIEERLRKEMEKELESTLQHAQSQIQQEYEARIQRMQQDMNAQAATASSQQKNMEELIKTFKLQTEQLAQERNTAQQKASEQFFAEQKKLREAFESESAKMRAMINDLRHTLEAKEKELAWTREQMSQIQNRHQEAPSAPGISPLPAEIIHEKPAETVPEQNIVPPAMMTNLPSFASGADTPVVSQQEVQEGPIYYSLDPENESRARQFRDELVATATKIFDHLDLFSAGTVQDLRGQLKRLIASIEARDLEWLRVSLEPYPEDQHFSFHVVNSTFLTLILAQEFSFSEEEKINLALASLLHDIGLVNVREDLNYPKKLTPELEKEVLNHPLKGAEILNGLVHQSVIDTVSQHHEIANGKGYPRGLKAQEIHIFAHILHIVDSFEALIHERPYRSEPLEVHEAMKQLIDTGRGVYDRPVLKALMVRIGLYPVMTHVELSNKQIALVVGQNKQYPLSPVVQIEYDETGAKLPKPQLINLSRSQFVHIVGPVKKRSHDLTSSRFAAVDHSDQDKAHKTDLADFLQHVISIAIVLSILLILLYVVIKI